MNRLTISIAALLSLTPLLPAQVRWSVAELDGGQEVPPVVTSASGWALIRSNDTTRAVDIFVHTVGLAGATAAHLHLAPAGSNGGILVPLAAGFNNSWQGAGVLSAANYAAFLAAGTYINVHTGVNPGGEIRGQVVASRSEPLLAFLSGSQEVPPVVSPAGGLGVFRLHTPSNVLTYDVAIAGLNPTAAHVHRGAVGVNGPIVVPLTYDPVQMRYCGVSGKLAASDVAAILAGDTYVNVHTAANPGGEIRGQLTPTGSAIANADLSGAAEVPPVLSTAIGHACLTLNPDLSITYNVETTGLIGATVAHIHNAPAGSNGGIVVPLTGGPTSWSGTSAPVSTAQLQQALLGNWYINVHTAANPGGEIRGQVTLVDRPAVFGRGCNTGGGPVPEIGTSGMLCPGSTYTLTLHGAPANTSGNFFFGVAPHWPPIDMTLIGQTNCFFYPNDIGVALPISTDALGCGQSSFTLPIDPNNIGLPLYNQAGLLRFGPTIDLIMSNAICGKVQ